VNAPLRTINGRQMTHHLRSYSWPNHAVSDYSAPIFAAAQRF